jgi:hypothetical protein
MREISNREGANNFYKVINSGVDDFITKTKARPSEIHKYLSKNGKRFLKNLELDDVEGIENILQDVISHRKFLEDDKIITFESFSKISTGFVTLSKPGIDLEKILSDKFNTSLGHIELVDPEYHLYKINDFGEIVYCMIFSEQDIEKIKSFIIERLNQEIKTKELIMSQIDNLNLPKLKFWLSDFINLDLLSENIKSKLSLDYIHEYILQNFFLVYSDKYTIESEITNLSNFTIVCLKSKNM